MLKLIRDILLYGSGDFLARVAGVLMLGVLARSVPAAELGMFCLIAVATAPLALLISFGGESTFTRFYLDTADSERRRITFTSWVVWMMAVAAGAITLIWLAVEPLARLLTGERGNARVVLLGFATLPAGLVGHAIVQVLRLQGQAGAFIGVNLGTQLLYLLLGTFAVLALEAGAAGVFAANLLAMALVLPVRLWLTRNSFTDRISADVLGRMVHFGTWSIVAAIGPSILIFADRLIVGKLLGLEVLAHYSIAGTLQSLLGLGVVVVGQAWLPFVLNMRLQRPEEVAAFAAKAATQLLLGFSAAAVLVMALADKLILVLAGPGFADAVVAVPGMAVASVGFGMTIVTGLGLQIAKSTRRAALIGGIAGAVGVALILVLTPRLGMSGAAFGTAIGYGTLALLLARASHDAMPIAYEWRRLTGLTALLLAFAVLVQPADTGSVILDLAWAGLLAAVFTGTGAVIAGIGIGHLGAVLKELQRGPGKGNAG